MTNAARQLAEDGYAVVRSAVPTRQVGHVRALVDGCLADQPRHHFRRFRHHGSMVPLGHTDPIVEVLLGSIEAHFPRLGFDDPRWLSGYVIAKPPGSPGLWWHQDWWAWSDPCTSSAVPLQVFCMVYLDDTSIANGCLRVLPGTHRRRHPLLDVLPEPHSEEIERAPANGIAHRFVPGEVAVAVSAGDMVVGDVRILHATHDNRTSRPRYAVDLVVLPSFGRLPARFKRHLVQHPCQPAPGWHAGSRDTVSPRVRHLLPIYDDFDDMTPDVRFQRRPMPVVPSKPNAASGTDSSAVKCDT